MTRAYIKIVANSSHFENIEDLSSYFGDVTETLEKTMTDASSMSIKLILNIDAEKTL